MLFQSAGSKINIESTIEEFFICLEVNLHGRLSKRREGSNEHTVEGRNRI